jgi:hypothetical protein
MRASMVAKPDAGDSVEQAQGHDAADDAREPDVEGSLRQEATRGGAFLRALLTTFAVFAVLEVAARVVLHFRTSKMNAVAAADYPAGTYLADFTARVDYRFVNLYTADPARANNEAYDFDTFGFRLDTRKLRFDAPAEFKRIWMLGGSTVQGLGVLADETIPAHLNGMLERDHVGYRVINMGQAGFTATQELLLLIETIQAGFRPDLVISYDGAAEVPFAGELTRTGVPGWEKHTPKAKLVLDVQGGESAGALFPLALLRLTKLDDLMISLVRPPGNVSYPTDNWEAVARRYLTTLNMIKSVAEDQGVPSLFFFQPILPYEEHYKLRRIATDEERFRSRASPDEYKRHDAVFGEGTSELRARLGPRFFDVHDVFRGRDGEKLYSDPRHPVGAGNRILAARLYEELKKVLPAPK